MTSPLSFKVQVPAVLHDIDWATYSRLLRVFDQSRRFRLTYDRGVLEIVPPSYAHERSSRFLTRLMVALLYELQLQAVEGGSVTVRRRRKQRDLDPDNCFWVARSAQVLGKTKLDFRTDPPPDLAVEVDITSSSLPRLPIYAALGVPEIWRLSNDDFTFQILNQGRYQTSPNSLCFPRLASADLVPFLAQLGQIDDTTLERQFRDWIRQHLLGGQPPPGTP